MFTLFVAGRVGEDIVFNEEEWASEEKSVPYEKSKRRAELAAWELVKGLPGIVFTVKDWSQDSLVIFFM